MFSISEYMLKTPPPVQEAIFKRSSCLLALQTCVPVKTAAEGHRILIITTWIYLIYNHQK